MVKKEKHDYPDYEELREKYRKIEDSRNPKKFWITGAIFILSGFMIFLLVPNFGFSLPSQWYLTPVYIVAFIILWGFFLPDLIMQELLKTFIIVPSSVRILSHVLYSYLLAWLLLEFDFQIKYKKNKVMIILTGGALVMIIGTVITSLILLSIL